ncbi:MAG: TldD/PmbA family protein [Clostridia bacterium]|nr:TldD/PmbA family protein [Clostridia bacterium]
MNFNEFKHETIEVLKENGIEEYELYYATSESTSINIYNGEINSFSSSNDGGVCIRLVKDGRFGYASTESLSKEDAVSIVKRAIENAKSLETTDPVLLSKKGSEYTTPDITGKELPATEKLITKVKKGYDELTAIEGVSDRSSTSIFSDEGKIAICNSNGVDLSYENSTCGYYASAIILNDGEMTDGHSIKAGDLDSLDTQKIAEEAVEEAKAKIGAKSAPTGVYPVLLSPEAMSSLVATYCGIFSAESVQKGLSKLKDKEGEVIASDILSIVDDPFYKESTMPIGFDDEGCPTKKKHVIKNGKLETLLYNLKTAAIAGKETTGNASKGSYSSPIGTSPFTFYIEAGDCSEEEIIEKAGNGVLIDYLGGLHAGANFITGDFSLQSSGFMIENGKKTVPVKSFTVAGNFYDLLKRIVAISNEVKVPRPFGKTSFGSPFVLIDNLSIAGK